MDVLITNVYDKLRFGYYVEAKFQMYKLAAITMANDINNGYFVKLCNLPECDVRYLQRPNLQYTEHFLCINKPICNLKILNNDMKQNQFEFKPFQQVLVRNNEKQTWKPNFYSFEGYNNSGHVCTNDMKYAQCIPYNKNTAHLVGTNQPYKEPEPKVWKVISGNYNNTLTSEELSNFIKTAVINNKDILDLRIVHIDK